MLRRSAGRAGAYASVRGKAADPDATPAPPAVDDAPDTTDAPDAVVTTDVPTDVPSDVPSDGTTGAFATADEIPDAPRARPVGLEIDSIGVSGYPVSDVGLEDDGQLEIPDETEIGWYKYGASAGQPGSTVLAAHVNWNGVQGPFARLGSVEPGDEIEVTLDDGTTRDYVVIERTMYGKLELPRERIWRRTGPEELVLITCGGEFNPEIRRFKSNIVVYAVPVG